MRDGRIVADGTPHALMNERAGRLRPRTDGDAAPSGRAAAARCSGRAPSRHDARMTRSIAEALARLPDYLGGHVAGQRHRAAARPARSACRWRCSPCAARRCATCCSALPASCRRFPSLALLALFYPLLLGLAALCERLFGVGLLRARLSAVGAGADALQHAAGAAEHHHRTATASIPPINEAALGVGMTRRQSLVMVELPLALPVIMAGIRTAAVWVIGAATLSTPIGQTEPRQLHLHRPADAELGVRAVRLRRRGRVRARGRSTAGADGSAASTRRRRALGRGRRAGAAAARRSARSCRPCRSRAPTT